MRLIDADALIADLYDEKKHSAFMAPFKLCTADRVDLKFLLNEAPTIDAVPVVHSKWEITEVDHAYGKKCYHCPECGTDEWRYDDARYCPNCGVKMDGERREDEEKENCPVKINYTESFCDRCTNDPCDADSMLSCKHGRNVDGVGDYRRREDNEKQLT